MTWFDHDRADNEKEDFHPCKKPLGGGLAKDPKLPQLITDA
jgi:hypothetical protein